MTFRIKPFILIPLLTAYALMVHGYHPYAEDGGLYVAGIRYLLNPNLYPQSRGFVTAHLHYSLFAPTIARTVQATHLPLPWILLLLYTASVGATLGSAWMLIARCTESPAARTGAVTLLAAWMTLPIAGTSLILADPCLTARSLSTPCTLLALAGMLDILGKTDRRKGWLLFTGSMLVAIALHPLMAGYALAASTLLACLGSSNPRLKVRGTLALCASALAFATILQLKAPAESPDYLRIALTRYYWFPARWEWFERIGLFGPLAVIAILLTARKSHGWQSLGRMALAFGTLAIILAAIFARPTLTTHLVARMQPLRSFQTIYLVMILMLGAWLGESILRRHPWRWIALLAGMGTLMFATQRTIYPASAHLEMPWLAPRNPWVQAFQWTRDNTAKDALFALDSHYITCSGEDAQSFRAIAERSMLPDYSKDGGEAAITPSLTQAWIAGQTAQTGLNQQPDAARIDALTPLGVSWIILPQSAETQLACPYANTEVKVCRIP